MDFYSNKTIRKIESFKYWSEDRKSYILIPSGLKHILVFGQSRQGKSSIINMMVSSSNISNGSKAEVSDSVQGVSFSTEPFFTDKYCFWDTAGLNEQESGTVKNSEATKNLIKFVRDSKGFHGAIMVVSWNNLNSTNTKLNWDLFYDAFLDQRVPLLMCITQRGIESQHNDQKWIDEQTPKIDALGFKCSKVYGRCVVYSKDLAEIENPILKEIYKDLREKSITYVNTLLSTHISDNYFNPIDEECWFDIFKKCWNTIMKFLNFKNLMITVRDAFRELLIKLGFSHDDADQISKETF